MHFAHRRRMARVISSLQIERTRDVDVSSNFSVFGILRILRSALLATFCIALSGIP